MVRIFIFLEPHWASPLFCAKPDVCDNLKSFEFENAHVLLNACVPALISILKGLQDSGLVLGLGSLATTLNP